MPKPGSFKKGVSGNPKGRPKVGLTFADKVRAVVGGDGQKLVEMWVALAWGQIPKTGDLLYTTALQQLANGADVKDRLLASKLLAERGFGAPKQEMEHSGEVAVNTRVVHEHQTVSE